MAHITADHIELAPATGEHADFAARLIPDTNPALFDYLHGHDRDCLHQHLAGQWGFEQGLFSHSRAILAMHGEQPAGMALGFSAAEHTQAIDPFVMQALELLGEQRFTELANRFALARYVQPEIPEEAWYLHVLAVAPEARGRGVGELLLRHCMEQAREQGYASLQLDVYANNPALRLYQRAGMEVIVETTIPPLTAEGIDTHYRMTMDL